MLIISNLSTRVEVESASSNVSGFRHPGPKYGYNQDITRLFGMCSIGIATCQIVMVLCNCLYYIFLA